MQSPYNGHEDPCKQPPPNKPNPQNPLFEYNIPNISLKYNIGSIFQAILDQTSFCYKHADSPFVITN